MEYTCLAGLESPGGPAVTVTNQRGRDNDAIFFDLEGKHA